MGFLVGLITQLVIGLMSPPARTQAAPKTTPRVTARRRGHPSVASTMAVNTAPRNMAAVRITKTHTTVRLLVGLVHVYGYGLQSLHQNNSAVCGSTPSKSVFVLPHRGQLGRLVEVGGVLMLGDATRC